jgi:hypothetical protein
MNSTSTSSTSKLTTIIQYMTWQKNCQRFAYKFKYCKKKEAYEVVSRFKKKTTVYTTRAWYISSKWKSASVIYTRTVSVNIATTAFTYAACHVRPLLYNKGTRDIYLC